MRLGKLSHLALATLAVATLAIGCASSGGNDEAATTTGTGSEWGDNTGSSDGSSMMSEGTRGLLKTVYFDYDSSAIRSDQRPVLQDNASKANQNASWKMVVVEGHCDERGSEEYNLALGERRAAAVKQYLMDSGVSGSKIDTVSFGEAKPAVQGHDESAWKWNRRAEFVVSQ
jgi:peptidoglycan-associated lipoprotein